MSGEKLDIIKFIPSRGTIGGSIGASSHLTRVGVVGYKFPLCFHNFQFRKANSNANTKNNETTGCVDT